MVLFSAFAIVIVDVIFHKNLPPAKPEFFRLGVRLVGVPTIVRNAIYSDRSSGAVGSAFAVDENGLIFAANTADCRKLFRFIISTLTTSEASNTAACPSSKI